MSVNPNENDIEIARLLNNVASLGAPAGAGEDHIIIAVDHARGRVNTSGQIETGLLEIPDLDELARRMAEKYPDSNVENYSPDELVSSLNTLLEYGRNGIIIIAGEVEEEEEQISISSPEIQTIGQLLSAIVRLNMPQARPGTVGGGIPRSSKTKKTSSKSNKRRNKKSSKRLVGGRKTRGRR
jgi:hypothetical protein